jgi:hypothetical protein
MLLLPVTTAPVLVAMLFMYRPGGAKQPGIYAGKPSRRCKAKFITRTRGVNKMGLCPEVIDQW